MSSKTNGGTTKTSQPKKDAGNAEVAFPSLKELEDMERNLQKDLIKLENDIYVTETKYIRQTTQTGGNVFKGWEGSNQQNTHKSGATYAVVQGVTRRQNRHGNQEKFFTLSSLSAPQDDDHQKSK